MNARILAIETSSETCSVALLNEGQVSHRMNETPRGHAKNILPMIQDLLAESELQTSDLDVIAVTNGPGAFTSIRIGVAVCQGLAAAIGCPVISVSSLAVMAHGAMKLGHAKSAAVALDARMSEIYLGVYKLSDDGQVLAIQPDTVIAPERVSLPAELGHLNPALAGVGWKVYEQELGGAMASIQCTPVELAFPRAIDLLDIAQIHYAQKKTHPVQQLQPVYLRDNVVHG